MILQRDFARIVQEQLDAQEISRSELARRMNATPQFVTNYLNGRNSPGLDVIERFFEALGFKPQLKIGEPISKPPGRQKVASA